jgi:hypothetical protein
MTSNHFRRIALGMAGAVEGAHMDHPDFRAANGRIFATLNEDHTRGMASLTPEQQAEFMKRAPDVFVPAAGAWGRGGSTMIVLAQADAEMVGEAVTLAWQSASAKPPARQAKAGRAAKPRSARAKITGRTPALPKRPARKRR